MMDEKEIYQALANRFNELSVPPEVMHQMEEDENFSERFFQMGWILVIRKSDETDREIMFNVYLCDPSLPFRLNQI